MGRSDRPLMQGSEFKRLLEAHGAFREVNDRIREVTKLSRFEGPTPFVCECGDRGCTETIELTLEDFEAIRWRKGVYVVRPGHERPEGEHVVAEAERFVLVESL